MTLSKSNIMSVDDIVILENLVDKYNIESLLTEMKFTKKQLCWLLSAGIITATSLSQFRQCNNKDDVENDVENVEYNNKYGVSESVYKEIQNKTNIIKNEIDRIQRKHGRTIESINFDPELMVYLCYKHKFDLPLMFTQAQHETGLGLEGIGPKCNSLFSIGAYDKNPTREKFNNQNSSINHYIRILKNNYLLNGKKTVNDLLKDGGFVNEMGNRYSSDKNYEKKIRESRAHLISRFPDLAKPFEK